MLSLLSSCIWVLLDLPESHPGGMIHGTQGRLCLPGRFLETVSGTLEGMETVTELSQLRAIALQAQEGINHFNL